MSETETAATLETPTRKFRVKLPSRSTVAKTTALTGAFVLGAVFGVKKLAKNDCSCESETANDSSDQSNT